MDSNDEKLQMQARLTELEIRLTHYEDTQDQLDGMIIRQSKEIDSLKFQLEQLNKKLKAVQSSPLALESEETPPPHY